MKLCTNIDFHGVAIANISDLDPDRLYPDPQTLMNPDPDPGQ